MSTPFHNNLAANPLSVQREDECFSGRDMVHRIHKPQGRLVKTAPGVRVGSVYAGVLLQPPSNKNTPQGLAEAEALQSQGLHLNLESFATITDDKVIQLARASENLASINLRSCVSVSDAAVTEIAKNCPQLREIDLSWCNITSASVHALARHCPMLTHIDLRSSFISDDAIVDLVVNCKHLKQLKLPWCSQLTDRILLAIARHAPPLEELDVRGCVNLHSNAMSEMFLQCQGFRALHLRRAFNAVNDKVLSSLSRSNPRLEDLNLRQCYKVNQTTGKANVTSEGVMNIARENSRLRKVDLSWQKNIQDEAIETLAKRCWDLESLDISGCDALTDRAVESLCADSRKLKKLTMLQCSRITPEAATLLQARGCTVLH